jgi:hypothetical protein
MSNTHAQQPIAGSDRCSCSRIVQMKSLDVYAFIMHINAYAFNVDHRRQPYQKGREAHRCLGKNGTGPNGPGCSYRQGKRPPPCQIGRNRAEAIPHPEKAITETMILVDTSVWIDHLRSGNARLEGLLLENVVLTHPFIVGELACGSLKNRRTIMGLLRTLPEAVSADHEEVLALLENEHLSGCGLGWIDAHLFASARLSHAGLWTLDRRLARIASKLGLSA